MGFVALMVKSVAINTVHHIDSMYSMYLTKLLSNQMYFSVCTRPKPTKCSILYEKNCIFGEECAVDVLNEEPWFSFGTCVRLPTKNKRFCIKNNMCNEDEICTRNYEPFVMDPWHNPGYVF